VARPRRIDLSGVSDESLVQEVLRRRALHEAAIRRMDQLIARAGDGGVVLPLALSSAKSRALRQSGSAGKRVGQKHTVPVHCIFHWPTGCRKPHKGPRFSFLCDEHRGIGKSEKNAARAAYKANNDGQGNPGVTKSKAKAAQTK